MPLSGSSHAHHFSLPGVDGREYCLKDFANAKVLVVIFMCNHCPYVLACIDRLVALQADFFGSGVRFVGVNSNDPTDYPEDSFDAMKVFSREKKMNFPYLFDSTQEVARAYGAVCTPDIFVYGEAKDATQFRSLLYHGRIDDNWKNIDHVTSHDLHDALEAIVAGKTPSADQKPSMGCSIKWK